VYFSSSTDFGNMCMITRFRVMDGSHLKYMVFDLAALPRSIHIDITIQV